jgi:MSHA biogenesis protein MshJ
VEKPKALFKKYADRIDALSLRERAIVFVAVLVALYGVAANLLFPPLFAEEDRLKKQLAAKRAQIQSFEGQIQAALAKSAEDPDAPNRARAAQLEAQVRALDESLGAMTARLVSPRDMARVVEQMLLKNRRLEIVRIESLPPEPLQPLSAAKEPHAGATAYRHGMRIELRGNYLDVLGYLRDLEALPWKVFWGQITLKVAQYPVSNVTLQIYTLSTRPGWIAL